MTLNLINEFERYMGDAFREDLEALLLKFEELQTFSFDAFADVWKDMKFSFIFA